MLNSIWLFFAEWRLCLSTFYISESAFRAIESTAKTINIRKQTLATVAAIPANPPNPKTPHTAEIIINKTVLRNIYLV